MRVLVACEYSGRVREAFRRRGHDAYSCDLLPSEDGSPFHFQDDLFAVVERERGRSTSSLPTRRVPTSRRPVSTGTSVCLSAPC